jgi:ribulose-5-phosphate 4-epimerase/fuculose-1-phosphate aldolase
VKELKTSFLHEMVVLQFKFQLLQMDEGYIKFKAVWEKSDALPTEKLEDLIHWRQVMYQYRLIGGYDNGIGYGNISQRAEAGNSFHISGSATGLIEQLSNVHFTTVTDFDIEKNEVHCVGPIIASSESMSHAVIYQECPEVMAVIHVHHLDLWTYLLERVPTTDEKATYGSPEMARSIIELLQKTQLRKEKIFVMKGHPEGIFVFGKTLSEASEILLSWVKKLA